MLGTRGLWQDGWKVVTVHGPISNLGNFDKDEWELYHVDVDPSETDDRAAAEPERLAALVDLWWEEARRYQVLPLDNRPLAALEAPRPSAARARVDRSVLHPGAAIVPETVAPDLRNRPHTIAAEVDGDGTLLRALHGPAGRYRMATGVRRHGDTLWLGSFTERAIARAPL
jgi:arylsulfatase